jgi:ACS family hexuronate transporter-like MFS transporter
MMIGPANIGFVSSPYMAIALFSLVGFAHQTISVLFNTLSADLFDSREVGTVSGFAGMAGWTGGLGFSLLVGALADSVGYGPPSALWPARRSRPCARGGADRLDRRRASG